MSIQQLSNNDLLDLERSHRAARRSASLSVIGHGIIGAATGGIGLVGWVGSVPKLGYNSVRTAQLKKERVNRGLERPKSRKRDALKIVGKTAAGLLLMDFDPDIPNIGHVVESYDSGH